MDQPQSATPSHQPPTEQAVTQIPTVNKKRKTIALWLLIGPTALIIGSILLFAVTNFITASLAPATSSELVMPTPPLAAAINIILFTAGAVSVATWLPGIIIGIVLLVTPKK
jgi:hypothetical protein